MKKILFAILALLLIPSITNAATLIENLEVEASAETYTFDMSKNTWGYTLYTDKDTANIKIKAKEGVNVTGAGEVSVKEGDNKIEISATNGTASENYILYLNVVKASKSEDGKVNPPTGINYPMLSIGILVVTGVLIMLLVRKKAVYKI